MGFINDFKEKIEKKYRDENHFFLKFFIDLNGNPIYSRRISDEVDVTNPKAAYQRHPQLAWDIINGNKELKALYDELKWVSLINHSQTNFLIYYGYVAVDADDNTEDHLFYDSETTPNWIIDEMKKDDPYESRFTRYDAAEQYNNEEQYKELCELHRRILEERGKTEKLEVADHRHDDDGER